MEKYLKMAVFRRYLVYFRRILDAFLAGFAADSGRIGAISTSRIRATDRVPLPLGSGPGVVGLYCLVPERLGSVVSQVSRAGPGAPGEEAQNISVLVAPDRSNIQSSCQEPQNSFIGNFRS